MSDTGSSEDEQIEELRSQLDTEERMWMVQIGSHPKANIHPNMNDTAAGSEAIRQLMIEKGVCTENEYLIKSLKIRIATYTEIRKKIINKELQKPGLPDIEQ